MSKAFQNGGNVTAATITGTMLAADLAFAAKITNKMLKTCVNKEKKNNWFYWKSRAVLSVFGSSYRFIFGSAWTTRKLHVYLLKFHFTFCEANYVRFKPKIRWLRFRLGAKKTENFIAPKTLIKNENLHVNLTLNGMEQNCSSRDGTSHLVPFYQA